MDNESTIDEGDERFGSSLEDGELQGGELQGGELQEDELQEDELQEDELQGDYYCTEAELEKGALFFDFDPQLVQKAIDGDDPAFQKLGGKLFAKYDQIQRQIQRRCHDWPLEHVERVRDSFVDRFLGVFRNPPKHKIENFNALCWVFLKGSIIDTWRYYRNSRRDFRREMSMDAPIEEFAGTFLDAHYSEITLLPPWGREDEAARSIDLSIVQSYLSKLNKRDQDVIRLWAFGWMGREIAEKLRMTPGNVGAVVNRTITRLREMLEEKHKRIG